MENMTFGLTLPQRSVFFGVTTMPKLLAMAADADGNELFESIWVGDSLLAKPRPEALTLLGALAGVTRRVKLAVGCMASFPVRDPFTFAYQWGTLDMISGGRMLLAACTGIVAGGASAREGAIWGVADKARASYMEENIEICRRLWSGDKVTFAGQYHSYTDVALDAKPVQQPCPIWIAANPGSEPYVTRAMQRVAAISDGWMTCEIYPDLFSMLYTKLKEELTACGKDADSFPNILYHNINISEDQNGSLDESQRFLDHYYGPVFSPVMVKAWTAAGTTQQCIDRIRELKAQGAQSMTFRITSWNQDGQYQRLINDVLPYVN